MLYLALAKSGRKTAEPYATFYHNPTVRHLLSILTLLVLCSCVEDDSTNTTPSQPADSLTTNSKANNDWTFEAVKGTTLFFKNGKKFETNLFELEYIGQISADNKAPFLIFSGRDCNECDANISIYVHSPAEGKLIVDHGQNRYQYPGTERDYETDRVVYSSRAFYGQVLENMTGLIWYEYRDMENDNRPLSVFLLYVDKGRIKDSSFIEKGTLRQTIALQKKGLCTEIAGRDYSSEP